MTVYFILTCLNKALVYYCRSVVIVPTNSPNLDPVWD